MSWKEHGSNGFIHFVLVCVFLFCQLKSTVDSLNSIAEEQTGGSSYCADWHFVRTGCCHLGKHTDLLDGITERPWGLGASQSLQCPSDVIAISLRKKRGGRLGQERLLTVLRFHQKVSGFGSSSFFNGKLSHLRSEFDFL